MEAGVLHLKCEHLAEITLHGSAVHLPDDLPLMARFEMNHAKAIEKAFIRDDDAWTETDVAEIFRQGGG